MSDKDLRAPAQILPHRPGERLLALRELTSARVGLERTGCSISTGHALDFAVAHAQARDAVHSTLGAASLLAGLRERKLEAVSVHSAATSRTEYLLRPDLGKSLARASATVLDDQPAPHELRGATSLTIILADGLSALAADRHALPLLDALLASLGIGRRDRTWALTPIVVAEQARVALGDAIGEALHADVTVMLIGERPGLSSPDSLGAYITWWPRPDRTDAERNCVSNIRAEGLDYGSAAAKIAWYLSEARRLGLTGVQIRGLDTGGEPPALGDPNKAR
jgi:ethanolamine ammonia-lyase small subunit